MVTYFSRQSFRDVKAHAIFFLLELEKQGKVTRQDGYQDILNAIASDVRSKHRKRLQRQQEKASMREALQHLRERKKAYEEQIKSYNDYVDMAMATMQKGKGCDSSIIFITSTNSETVPNVALSCHLRSNSSICVIYKRPANHLNSVPLSIALRIYTPKASSSPSINFHLANLIVSISSFLPTRLVYLQSRSTTRQEAVVQPAMGQFSWLPQGSEWRTFYKLSLRIEFLLHCSTEWRNST